jgi:uncharacterized protein
LRVSVPQPMNHLHALLHGGVRLASLFLRAVLMLFAAGLLVGPAALAQGVLPVPALTARVIDSTGTLDAIQLTGLEQKLAAFEQEKGTQIAILMVPTTQPEDIASFANRVANEWKIGRKAVGDGVLLVVAKNDRKVRIEVAKTLEGAVPDLAASQIIETAITPNFRKNDYAAGLQAAADQLIARINGEALPAPPAARSQPGSTGTGDGFNWMNLAIFLFFAVPVAGAILRRIMGSKLGALAVGGGVGAIAMVITSSLVIAGVAGVVALLYSLLAGGMAAMGGARRSPWVHGGIGGLGAGGWSGGGGGLGGGGFSSGGGGNFGGGGASGDW